MSKLPALRANLPDAEIAKEAATLLVAIKFTQNKKNNFESMLKLCRKADIFLESVNGKKTSYLVGFSKTVEQAKLAVAVLEEMRITGWTYLLFANGRVQLKKQALLNVLDCFCVASRLKDHRKHCHRIYDDPLERFLARDFASIQLFDAAGDPLPEEVSWLMPCQYTAEFVVLSKEEMRDPVPYIDAVAERRMTNACPYYSSKEFKVIEPKTQLGKPKRYW